MVLYLPWPPWETWHIFIYLIWPRKVSKPRYRGHYHRRYGSKLCQCKHSFGSKPRYCGNHHRHYRSKLRQCNHSLGMFRLAKIVCNNACDIMTQYCLPYLPWQHNTDRIISINLIWPRKVSKPRYHGHYHRRYGSKLCQCKHSFGSNQRYCGNHRRHYGSKLCQCNHSLGMFRLAKDCMR
jgi:hypothetical protein